MFPQNVFGCIVCGVLHNACQIDCASSLDKKFEASSIQSFYSGYGLCNKQKRDAYKYLDLNNFILCEFTGLKN